jgi:putative transposase
MAVSDQRGRRCPAVITGADEPQVQREAPFPFLRFNSSPEVIRLVVMMYVRFPLSLRNVEDLLFERGIDVCHETVRMWWNRFGPMFAGDIRRQRVSRMRGLRHWRWHLDEMYVKLNGEMVYLWRAVDHEVGSEECRIPCPADDKA